MLSANQVAGFPNQLFLENKLMKQPHFLPVGTSSQKLKVDKIFLLVEMSVANLVFGL